MIINLIDVNKATFTEWKIKSCTVQKYFIQNNLNNIDKATFTEWKIKSCTVQKYFNQNNLTKC